MEIEPGSIEHLAQIISHIVAPAFLLSAVGSFVSILNSRLNGVIERLRDLNSVPQEGHVKSKLKADIPRLKRRAALLRRALLLSIAGGVAGTILIIIAFGAALVSMTHVYGAAILFMISLGLLCASLVVFGIELKIGLNEYDEY
jgi:hypothetical protein